MGPGPAAPSGRFPEAEPPEAAPPIRPSRGVLNELARGFLLGKRARNAESVARLAFESLRDRTDGAKHPPAARPRTVRGPLPRAVANGRSLEPPPPR